MFNSYIVALSMELNNGTYHQDDFLIAACREYHLDIINSSLEMWMSVGSTDDEFIEMFESVFPPGFIRRDMQRAKNVIQDLYDIAISPVIRNDLKPIYTYVMYRLITEWLDLWIDNNDLKSLIPKGLKEYFKNMKVDKEQQKTVIEWFSRPYCCADDFEDTYNGDYTNISFAELIAQMYLEDDDYALKLGMLGVEVSEFFDLLPADLRERCLEKYKTEYKNGPIIFNEYDFFISYASEDKQEVALPLAEALENLGAKVWIDKFELTIGDSLRESIDLGLKNANHGIVILSPVYFNKFWTQKELNSLFFKSSNKRKVILPIRHGMSANEVSKQSLLLADLFSLSTDEYSIPQLADKIFNARI